MKKTTLQVKTESEKVEALRIFLSEKDGNVEAELADYVDVLYKKYVPATVREYSEKTDAKEKVNGDGKHRRVAARKPVCGDSAENEEVPADSTEKPM